MWVKYCPESHWFDRPFLFQVDSYSGFYDNGGFKQTELDGVLKSHAIQRVIITGLAFDYCVYYSSKDAASLGNIVLTHICLVDPSILINWTSTFLRGCAGWSAPLLFAYGIRHIFVWPGSPWFQWGPGKEDQYLAYQFYWFSSMCLRNRSDMAIIALIMRWLGQVFDLSYQLTIRPD